MAASIDEKIAALLYAINSLDMDIVDDVSCPPTLKASQKAYLEGLKEVYEDLCERKEILLKINACTEDSSEHVALDHVAKLAESYCKGLQKTNPKLTLELAYKNVEKVKQMAKQIETDAKKAPFQLAQEFLSSQNMALLAVASVSEVQSYLYDKQFDDSCLEYAFANPDSVLQHMQEVLLDSEQREILRHWAIEQTAFFIEAKMENESPEEMVPDFTVPLEEPPPAWGEAPSFVGMDFAKAETGILAQLAKNNQGLPIPEDVLKTALAKASKDLEKKLAFGMMYGMHNPPKPKPIPYDPSQPGFKHTASCPNCHAKWSENTNYPLLKNECSSCHTEFNTVGEPIPALKYPK
jgi:hypothetical protein